MSRIRKIEIRHFRCIQEMVWTPGAGVNCLIGPGDAGKSTILDAIDLCLGARRNAQFVDTDFYKLDVSKPIQISVTIGELSDALNNFETYGIFLRGFDVTTGELLSEPEANAEPVLTLRLIVGKDLEPSWSLYSERTEGQNQTRNLNWADRVMLAPTRLGVSGEYNLGWRRGSILNRVSDESADGSGILVEAAREARRAFGDTAKNQVPETLAIVKRAANDLGIPVGDVTAMLDADSVSFSGGMISLHNSEGVPLRSLGLGSTRLLIAGLQREVAAQASIILVDEIEHGLEPHRIIRLISSLGAKETPPPLQVFMTTHSPVALRELSADQLYILRPTIERHEVRNVGGHDDMQRTVRACPEAFLASAVIVCEGASEIGLLRGLDISRTENGLPSIMAQGVALADGHGDTTLQYANAFAALGYRVLILRDSDKAPDAKQETLFIAAGGTIVAWRNSRALEEELFNSLSDSAVRKLVEAAVEHRGQELIDANLKTASSNTIDLEKCLNSVTPEARSALGKAAKAKKSSWFKSITDMEMVGREIVAPDLANCDAEFRAIIEKLFTWVADERK
jgi:predicted ATPase